jgi:TRAP-type C4-dicarboxylate transport system permease small subunit
MPGHLSTRIFTAATGPLVRKAAPVVQTTAAALVQLLMLSVVGGLALAGRYIVSDLGVPDSILTVIAVALILIPLVFGLVVVAEQIRITYAKPTEAVYPVVEVFPDREPA